MSDPFLGEIRAFCFNFAPIGWAFCDGGMLPVQQNRDLFNVLKTTYGGDGKNSFGLPNLMPAPADPTVGKTPIGAGAGPGLTPRALGASGGVSSVILSANNLQWHIHNILAAPRPSTTATPDNTMVLGRSVGGNAYTVGTGQNGPMFATDALAPFYGGGKPHLNLMPTVTVNFCIAISGLKPA